MSNSDEDEDVIFQGSAIDQHLKSTGYADYESTQIASCCQEKNCPSGGLKQKVEWPFVRRNRILDVVKSLFWPLEVEWPFVRRNRILDVVKSLFWPLELRKHFYKRIVRSAYESKLLIPDDHLLLKHFIPHDFLPGNQSDDYFWIIEAILWCYRGLLLCAFLCFSLVLIFLKASANWSLLFLMLIVTSAIWILSVSWDLYKSTCEAHNFLCVLQNSGHLISKVLRFLLEEDLISRGFVLAQGSSSFASRGRTEPPYCEGLRHTLHDTLYFILPVLRHAHSHLKISISYYPCIRGLFDEFEEINIELQDSVTEHLKFLKVQQSVGPVQTNRSSGDTGNLPLVINEKEREGSIQKLSNIESQGSQAVDNCLKKTSNSSNLPSLEYDDFEDSDDERVALFKKVKGELERDEKFHVTYPLEDSDDEKLEVYRKFRNELAANEKLHHSSKVQGRDSNDERLKAYRKARKKIEMEKNPFSADSKDESVCEKSNFKRKFAKGKKAFFSKGLNIASKPAYEDSNLHRIADTDRLLQNVSDREIFLDNSIQQNIGVLNIQKVLDISKRDESPNNTDSSRNSSDKTNTKYRELTIVGEKNAESTASCKDLRCFDYFDSSKTLEEETFVHCDDTDGEDDSLHIDWGTVTLPSRMTDTLEDRMQLFCSNSLGFHAGLAAEAVEASQKFLSKKNVETETFHGVGEGEGFGDESETE